MQYVLVHGAWHSGDCWNLVAEQLREKGHSVSCLDLPSPDLSVDPAPSIPYGKYYDFLVSEIKKYNDPVVLVAHSMSGILAAPLLDEHDERISHLFLIAAYVAQKGESLHSIAVAGGPSQIPDLLINGETTQSLQLGGVGECFYHDCPPEITATAIGQLKPQSKAIFTTPVDWVDSGKTRSKRTYVLCENDRAVHPTTQLNVLEQYPCNVVRINSGHSPFLSQPKRLVDILTSAPLSE